MFHPIHAFHLLILSQHASSFAPNARPAFSATTLSASHAPQYDKREATVVSNEEIARGSYLLRVTPSDSIRMDYSPGHVIALEVLEGDEWLRGPYTLSRADSTTFDVTYRVVGKKSQLMSSLEAGKDVRFGGKFKVPIAEGIQAEGLERVVLISTGVGVGPMIGFAEGGCPVGIELCALYRNEEDVCFREELDALAKKGGFSWTTFLSGEKGRITQDKEMLEKILGDGRGTHYHLIGNGSMVNEFKEGLMAAGVEDKRVTIEMYFNHKVEARPEVVDTIANTVRESQALIA